METLVWPFVLLLAGVAMIFLEIFIPSGGILGVLAACAVVASVIVGFSESFFDGTVMLLSATVLVPAVIGLAIKWWPHTPIGRLVLIKRPESEDEVLPDTEEYHLRDQMIGKIGVAKSELLPSGDIVIEGKTYDAVSIGMPVSKGQAIKVVSVDTQRLIVRTLTEGELEASKSDQDVLSTPIDSLGIDPFDDSLA